MKTPRELLFEQHKNAAPDLDQIRRDVLKKMACEVHEPGAGPWRLWSLLPSGGSSGWQFQIAGLAAAWLVILALNVLSNNAAPGAPSNTRVSFNRTVTMAWREYRRQLSEALDSQPSVATAKPDQRSYLNPINPATLTNA